MSNYNRVVLMGRLTRDPEVRYTPKGAAVCDFGLAINRTWTDNGEKKEECTFIDVTAWAKTAELVGQYLKKGSQCLVEGRLQTESWDDKQTGQKRTKLKVISELVQFIGGKQESNGDEGGQRQAAPPRQQSSPKGWAADPKDTRDHRSLSQQAAELDDSEVPF